MSVYFHFTGATDDAQLVRLIRQCSARDRKLLFVLVNQMLVNGDAKS